jgi:hypothetical protein
MDERSATRVVVDLELNAAVEGHQSRVLAYDLSVDGCMMGLLEGPAPVSGTACDLSLPDGTLLRGTVAWSVGTQCGVQFAEPIHEAVVRHLGFKPSPQPTDFHDKFGRLLPTLAWAKHSPAPSGGSTNW